MGGKDYGGVGKEEMQKEKYRGLKNEITVGN